MIWLRGQQVRVSTGLPPGPGACRLRFLPRLEDPAALRAGGVFLWLERSRHSGYQWSKYITPWRELSLRAVQ